ncbi:hypothetical protein B0T17DRAFT_511903 [Bombardia bombarda]|uniref:Uncharacterized protein n=1 Tax=Bombardia bombarda TaxID=252184 RepID=A0AA39U3N0_9PEZI|nr:hypothetical protein B0T17DRAFT_511903 [Bombardia bombarda]
MEQPQGNQPGDFSSCGIEGKDDLYGLGIRLGVYLQTLTLIISGLLRQRATPQLLNLGAVYQFALLFGVIYATVRMEDFYAVEAIVMVIFSLTSLGINHSAFLTLAGQSPTEDGEKLSLLQRTFTPLYGLVLRYTVVVAIDAYQVWLWFVGLDRLLHTECTKHSFFFARVDIYGNFRKFAKFYSVFVLVFATVYLLLLIQIAVRWKRRKGALHTEASKPTGDRRRGAVSSVIAGVAPWMVLPGISLILVLMIFAIELTIRWSNIHGVYNLASVGQIIPFIVSAGGLVGTVVQGREEASDSDSEHQV